MTTKQTTPENIMAALLFPFDPAEVSWRASHANGDGTRSMALAYIDARAVMDRLDAVMGPENWQDTYREVSGRLVCTISLRINGEWIAKEDGAGDTDFEGAKGGLSDAFKRAAVKWGVGRYLYSLPGVWATCEKRGKTVVLTGVPKMPKWATPAGWEGAVVVTPQSGGATGDQGTTGTQGAQAGPGAGNPPPQASGPASAAGQPAGAPQDRTALVAEVMDLERTKWHMSDTQRTGRRQKYLGTLLLDGAEAGKLVAYRNLLRDNQPQQKATA
jgi:hypothetical protein